MRSSPLIALAVAGLTLAALGVWRPGGPGVPEREESSPRPDRGSDPRRASEGSAPASGDRTTGGIARLRRAVDAAPGVTGRAKVTIGESSRGRPIRAAAAGGHGDGPVVLVVGCIHGTECAGIEVAEAVHRGGAPHGGGIVVVPDLNPDGRLLRTRVNARGVDLNRNFDSDWRPIGAPGDLEHSGPRPFSEPETRLARRLIRDLLPEVTIWLHQQAKPLVRGWGPSVPTARAYAELAGTPFHRLPWLAGTAPNWQNARFPETSSFVAELPLGEASEALVARHARAIATLARQLDGGGA